MKTVICAPENLIPQQLDKNIHYFSTYTISKNKNVGSLGSTLIQEIQKAGFRPSEIIWDFNTIALSVAAADNSVSRSDSADGWTRQIDLTIYLCNPTVWENVKQILENVLRFLTGDFWYINFKSGGINPPHAKKLKLYDCDCIALISGGIDSLVGAIDLVTDNNKPIFVSQVVRGNADTQREFAQKIRPASTHFQWNHNIHLPKEKSEPSTRGRSIVFLAFAALASSAMENQQGIPRKIFISENGFISLNIPLNPGRTGSFSTKTTHPVFMSGIQKIWDKLGLNLKLINRYQFKTKGELLSECKNALLLSQLVSNSTSCGKYGRYGLQHCGRCVPCMVRRAAFLKANITDTTIKGYNFNDLSISGKEHGPNDVGAMASACLRMNQFGVHHLISGNLSFADQTTRKDYEAVITRGFREVEVLLKRSGVI